MIEWLITNHHYIPTSIVLSFALTILVTSKILFSKESREETVYLTPKEYLLIAITKITVDCRLNQNASKQLRKEQSCNEKHLFRQIAQ